MDAEIKTVVLGMFAAMVVDGIDLQMLALALPSIMKDLNLSNVVGGSIGTWTLAGMGTGGILGGWVSDRWGRIKVIWWCLFLFSIATACIATCNTYWQIAFARVIAGCGIGAVYAVGMAMISEFVPTKWRATAVGTLQAGWSLGYVVAGIMSAYILPAYGWQALFLASIVPGAISLSLLYSVKEPQSYLASRQATLSAGKRENEFVKIWSNKQIRYTFIAWCCASIALQFGYYGANTWLPSYLVKELGVDLKNAGWYVASTYAAMALSKATAGYLGDKFGRRVVWFVSCAGSAVALPLIVYYATPLNVAFLLIFFGLLGGAPYGVNGAYMSESFPTAIRATALGTSYNIGRLGAMSAPLMIGYVSGVYSIAVGIAFLGITYAICALIPPLTIREMMYDPKEIVEPSQGSKLGEEYVCAKVDGMRQ